VPAELAAGIAARDLVPGDPDEVDRLAAKLSVFATGMNDAAHMLSDVQAANWTGPAAEAFSALVGDQPDKYRKAGVSFAEAVTALHAYTAVLRRAQADAGRAVTQFERASRESERWQTQRTAYESDVRSAAANGAPAPADPAPPASDPAAADLDGSRQLLAGAREEVRAQGRLTAEKLIAAAEDAPDKPGLLDHVIGGAGDFFGGVWEGIKGLGETAVLIAKLSTVRMLIDPEGWRRDVTELGKGLWWGVTHPVEFGKAIIDWETWKENPVRALGKLVPDIAIAIATAGAGTAASASSRAAARGIDAAGDAAEAARDIDRAADAGRAADNLPDPSDWPAGDGPDLGGAPVVIDPAATRVKLRVGTKRDIQAAAPKTPDGDYIDPNTGQVISKEGPFDYGHKPGYEWWRTRDRARAEGWTREQVIEFENDPSHYEIEDLSSNRSHEYEAPRDP
jgi:hypothetical protein